MEIKKGQYYVCIKDVVMDDETIGYSQGKCYCSDKQYYLVDNKQQLLVKELKLKIELAKIEFMKCGLSEDEAIEQVDMVLKAAFKEVFYHKK